MEARPPGPVWKPKSTKAVLLHRMHELLDQPLRHLHPNLDAIRTRKPAHGFGAAKSTNHHRRRRDLREQCAIQARIQDMQQQTAAALESKPGLATALQPMSRPSGVRFPKPRDDDRMTHLIHDAVVKPLRPSSVFRSKSQRACLSEDDADLYDDDADQGDGLILHPQAADKPRVRGGSFGVGYSSDTEAQKLRRLEQMRKRDDEASDILAPLPNLWAGDSKTTNGVRFDRMLGRDDDDDDGDSGLNSLLPHTFPESSSHVHDLFHIFVLKIHIFFFFFASDTGVYYDPKYPTIKVSKVDL